MTEKIELLKRYIPKALLEPMTEEARGAVPMQQLRDGRIVIDHFPFRVGRESRAKKVDGGWQRMERQKKDDSQPNNDLYLLDKGRLLNISREHFQIEESGGDFVVVDRGSVCGTRVGEIPVYGEARVLADGDLILVGTKSTPYVYRFIVLNGFTIVEEK